MKNIPGLLACLLWLPLFHSAQAQSFDQINPELYHQWTARWISHPDDPGEEYGVFHFRKEFALETVPETFVVHVSVEGS